MQQRIQSILEKHILKIEETKQDQEDMKEHQTKTYSEIDQFFDLVKKRVEQRCDSLKEDYKRIE